jgi:two-component system chemotaxis response regulator CheY
MAVRKERTMSVIMIDADHFKNINDQFGHAIGDLALQQIANILKQNSRAYDRAGRWGGEEFILILSDTKLKDAAIAAERLRRQTAEVKIPLENGETFSVQISLGVACTADGFPSLAKLIEAADQALYKAKQTGRNRVCIFGLE